MLGLCSDKKYDAMTNYNNVDDNVDDNNNAASGSVFDGSIFDTIMMTWSCGGVLGNNSDE